MTHGYLKSDFCRERAEHAGARAAHEVRGSEAHRWWHKEAASWRQEQNFWRTVEERQEARA